MYFSSVPVMPIGPGRAPRDVQSVLSQNGERWSPRFRRHSRRASVMENSIVQTEGLAILPEALWRMIIDVLNNPADRFVCQLVCQTLLRMVRNAGRPNYEVYFATPRAMGRLMRRVRDSTDGFKRKEERHNMRTYQNCFTASIAVEWLKCNLNISKQEAIHICEAMAEKGKIKKPSGEEFFQYGQKHLYQFVEKKKVVVAGGGFGGCMVAKLLDDFFDVTILDKSPYFENKPLLPQLISTPSRANEVTSELDTVLKNGKFTQAELVSIKEDRLLISNGRLMAAIPFDYLVMATGSRCEVPDAISGDRVVNCMDLEAMSNVRSRIAEEECKSILIVGGGLIGVEIAAKVGIAFPDKKITLVSRSDTLVHRLPRDAGKIVLQYLKRHNCDVILGQTVTRYYNSLKFAETDSKTKISADLVIACVGFKPNTTYLEKNMEDCLNQRGHIKVNDYLQVQGHPNMFACGNTVWLEQEALISNAENHAAIVAKNIISLDQSEKLTMYNRAPLHLTLNVSPTLTVIVNRNDVRTKRPIISKVRSWFGS